MVLYCPVQDSAACGPTRPSAWTLGASQYHDAEGPALSPVPGRCGAKGKRIRSPHGFPLVRRVKKLFSCVLLDEAQDVKGKLSLRGVEQLGPVQQLSLFG